MMDLGLHDAIMELEDPDGAVWIMGALIGPLHRKGNTAEKLPVETMQIKEFRVKSFKVVVKDATS